jgi:hypothetical protein
MSDSLTERERQREREGEREREESAFFSVFLIFPILLFFCCLSIPFN